MSQATASIDFAKLDAFMGKMVGEMGASINAPLILLGDRLGIYKAMAGAGPLTPAQLAAKISVDERLLREWLNAQAAGGILEYDGAAQTYLLPPEQAMAFAHENSPAFLCGAFQILNSIFHDLPKIEAAFKSGNGLPWHEHDVCLFRGTERFFRPGYAANLVSSWIPALEGVQQKLEQGATVADVGCGHGASTILMAKAFPQSTFHGFDYHGASISAAQLAAEEAGLDTHARIHFHVAPAKSFPRNDGYDLVTFFDSLHDMGDPLAAASHVRSTLKPGGTWMIVEPLAGDTVAENLNPVSRIFYCASTMICTPNAKSQAGTDALGAQAGEKRLRGILQAAGFQNIRRAAQTPFNMVLEAR